MMSEQTHGHEMSGVNVRAIGVFILCFIVAGGGLLSGMAFLMGALDRHVHRGESGAMPAAARGSLSVDQPLQPSPGHPTLDWQDAVAMKAAQQKELNSYGVLAGDPKHLRIPIDRAIHLLVEKQLLASPPATDGPANTQPYINTTQPSSTENRT